jgi:hypothetical protein
LLAAASAIARGADPSLDAWELVAKMAQALGTGDPAEFLSAFDAAMAGLAILRANVTALIAQWDVESGIDPVRNEGDDRAREVDVDWLLHLADRTGLDRVLRRRETVKLRMEKKGRNWKVVSLAPAGFFAPPSA